MMIAHLPAGYLAARAALGAGAGAAFYWGLLAGSVAPDVDMLWFHLVDNGRVHHHDYLTHRPILWLGVLVLGLVSGWRGVAGLGLGGMLHMLLDSIAGRIGWLWPWSDDAVTLVTVPATQGHWVLSFLAHWTFAVEIGITLAAVWLFLRDRRAKRIRG